MSGTYFHLGSLICKECKSFLMLKSVDLTKGIKLAVFNLVIKHVFRY